MTEMKTSSMKSSWKNYMKERKTSSMRIPLKKNFLKKIRRKKTGPRRKTNSWIRSFCPGNRRLPGKPAWQVPLSKQLRF